MALTLNRLNKEITTFQQNHDLLNSWLFGDPWEKNAKFNIQYPMLFGMVRPSPIQGTSETFVIEFFVCDKPGVNKRGEIEALSDTKQIANDVLAYFAGETFVDDFQIDKQDTVNIVPFVESFDNNVCGWSFELPLKQPFEWDLCVVPYSGSPAELSDGAATIYDQNNNLRHTLYPGDMLILNDLTFKEEDYTISGSSLTSVETPAFVVGLFIEGQRATLGERLVSIVGNVFNLDDDYTGSKATIVYYHT